MVAGGQEVHDLDIQTHRPLEVHRPEQVAGAQEKALEGLRGNNLFPLRAVGGPPAVAGAAVQSGARGDTRVALR